MSFSKTKVTPKKFLINFIFALGLILFSSSAALSSDYTITQLTNNNYYDSLPQIHNGQVAWSGYDGHDWEIFLYDGTQTINLSNNDTDEWWFDLHNGQVAWLGWDGHDWEIFFYDGIQTINLSNNDTDDWAFDLHNGQVVWDGYDGHDWEIFLYDGTKTIQLTNNDYDDARPQIDNGQVVWMMHDGQDWKIFFYDGKQTIQLTSGGYPQIHNGQAVWEGYDGYDIEIFLYTGTQILQISNNEYTDWDPLIHNGQIAWHGFDGHDFEIFLYDGTQTINLTNNDTDEWIFHLHNGQVVWDGYDGHDYEIFLYNGKQILQLTNNDYDDGNPWIHNGQVVWMGWDGNDYEIFLAEIPKIPLGGAKEIKDVPEPKFYRIYIPTRWGGTLTVTTTDGSLELYYPDTSTKIAGPDTALTYEIPFERNGEPVDEHGWYYLKCSGAASYKISNTFVQEGEAAYRPWNFWYYPLLKNELHPERNLYNPGGVLDKYDKAFGTDARTYEEKHNSTTDPEKFWWGHCLGGSIASILVPQPQATTYSGESFNQEETEGLVTKLANTKNVFGKNLVTGIPSMREEDEIVIAIKPQSGEDETDEYVDKFHKGLVDYLRVGIGKGKERKPLQSNLRDPDGVDPSSVWNHAIYKYKLFMKEAEEGKKDIIKITTTIYANADVFLSDNTIHRTETYVYKLDYTPEGEVYRKFTEQDWISATGFAPENLLYISKCWFDNTYRNNPYVTKANVEKLGVDFP